MTLTREQQQKVEENMGLVGKVIKDKVHGTNQYGIYSYDDLFQIGCIGLCKAAATDKGGHFSTYAYRLIWNEICDALIYANRRKETELLIDYESLSPDVKKDDSANLLRGSLIYDPQSISEDHMELEDIIRRAKANAAPTVQKGIDAMLMMQQGYSAREIGEQMDATPNLVTAWVSKARKHLKSLPELQQFYVSGGCV